MSILENSNGDTARRHMAPARAAPLQSGMVFIKHAAPSLLMQWLQQGRSWIIFSHLLWIQTFTFIVHLDTEIDIYLTFNYRNFPKKINIYHATWR